MFTISSPGFASGKPMLAQSGLRHQNISPALRIANIPANAKSLVLIVEDPDSPSGLWTHWLVWNLPATLKLIHQGKLPPGAQVGKNSFGDTSYDGPSPPSGTHRYFFRVYAVDKAPVLPAGAERVALLKAMDGHIVGTAEMFGTFTAE
jgi:Raf kinase inhibitor-like YbhB/YbcL family protein